MVLSFVILLVTGLFSCMLWNREMSSLSRSDDKINWIQADKLGNMYLNLEDRLIKYDKHGKMIAEFTHPVFGQFTSWDVSDPYKIVLFFIYNVIIKNPLK